MKKLAALILILAMIFTLAACGGSPAPEPTSVDTPKPVETPAQPAETPQTAQEPEEEIGPWLEDVVLEIEDVPAEAAQIGHIKGICSDGSVGWTYDTDLIYITELETIQKIGICEDGFLFAIDGTITCIGIDGDSAGKVIWKNEDFKGASASWCWDDMGNLYICGYYGPTLMVMSSSGKTLAIYDVPEAAEYYGDKMRVIDEPEYYWPSNIALTENGFVKIGFFSNDGYLVIDPETGGVFDRGFDPAFVMGAFVPNPDAAINQMLAGQWGDDPITPSFVLTISPDGQYFAYRNDWNTGESYEYAGNWFMSYYNADPDTMDPDWIFFPFFDGTCNDPAISYLSGLGDYQISFETSESDLMLQMNQLNNGDSLFYAVYGTFSPTLFKLSDDTSLG